MIIISKVPRRRQGTRSQSKNSADSKPENKKRQGEDETPGADPPASSKAKTDTANECNNVKLQTDDPEAKKLNDARMRVMRHLTTETMRPEKGRVWMVSNPHTKVYTVGSILDEVINIGAEWVLGELNCDSNVDIDGIVVITANNVAEAMNLAKVQGADRFVSIDESSDSVLKSDKELIALAASSPATIDQGSSPVKAAAAALTKIKVEKRVGKKLDLSGITVDEKAVEALVQESAAAEEEKSGKHSLMVSATNIIRVKGKARVAGTIVLLDSDGSVFWAFKPQAVAMALMALLESAAVLAPLRPLVSSLYPVSMRRFANGQNIAKTVKGRKGGDFRVEQLVFFLDLTSDTMPEAKLQHLLADLHEVITSDVFKVAYMKVMREMPKLTNLGSSIERLGSGGGNPVWAAFRECDLKIDMPCPLSTYLLDDDIKAVMTNLTFENDPSRWTDEQCEEAYLEGKIPGALKP